MESRANTPTRYRSGAHRGIRRANLPVKRGSVALKLNSFAHVTDVAPNFAHIFLIASSQDKGDSDRPNSP